MNEALPTCLPTYQSLYISIQDRNMSRFIQLPNELIIEIIDLVLCASSISIPPNIKRHRLMRPEHNTRVCYIQSKDSLRPNALDLLLTCSKLHSLTMDYLSHRPQTWKLDVGIINDHWLLPTWRYIAPRTTVVDAIERLEINVIPCFTEDEREKTTTWLSGDETSPERQAKCIAHFWGCIAQILATGPRHSMFNSEGEVAPSSDNRLVRDWITIVPSTYYGSGNDILSYKEIPVRRIDGLAHLDFDPLYPIDSATCNRLSSVLNSSAQIRRIEAITLNE